MASQDKILTGLEKVLLERKALEQKIKKNKNPLKSVWLRMKLAAMRTHPSGKSFEQRIKLHKKRKEIKGKEDFNKKEFDKFLDKTKKEDKAKNNKYVKKMKNKKNQLNKAVIKKVLGVPNKTGPYGRGKGPGKGKADGSGMKKIK